MREGSAPISSSASWPTAVATVSDRPSQVASPHPTTPSEVSIRTNNHLGATRNVSTRSTVFTGRPYADIEHPRRHPMPGWTNCLCWRSAGQADRDASATEVTRPCVEPPGQRRPAVGAATVGGDAVGEELVVVALDEAGVAGGAVRDLAARIDDVARVDVVQPLGEQHLAGATERRGRC